MNAACEQPRHPRVGERVTACGARMIVEAVELDPYTGNLYVRAFAACGCLYRRAECFRRGWPPEER